jgi:uncharacterized protein YbcI
MATQRSKINWTKIDEASALATCSSLKEELSERMASWYESEMGMRPSAVKVASQDEMVFSRFKDVLSPSVLNLSTQATGRRLLKDVTESLCRETFPTVKGIVSEITGLELLDMQVEVNLPLNEKIYILTLDRPLEKSPKVVFGL